MVSIVTPWALEGYPQTESLLVTKPTNYTILASQNIAGNETNMDPKPETVIEVRPTQNLEPGNPEPESRTRNPKPESY